VSGKPAANRRSYSRATIQALTALSEGRCYFPGCLVPVLVFVQGVPRVNLEIAHIVAIEDNGPRADPQMPLVERNAFENLMLMCQPHHTTIDQDEETYTLDVLWAWKYEREGSGLEALDGLSGLTERRLEGMIGAALQQREIHLDQALERLERIDASAARWLTDLRSEVEALRQRPLVDTETVLALERAAYGLRRLDKDTVEALESAVRGLRNLSGMTEALAAAVAEAKKPPPWM
jgi:hypothetical protein